MRYLKAVLRVCVTMPVVGLTTLGLMASVALIQWTDE